MQNITNLKAILAYRFGRSTRDETFDNEDAWYSSKNIL